MRAPEKKKLSILALILVERVALVMNRRILDAESHRYILVGALYELFSGTAKLVSL